MMAEKEFSATRNPCKVCAPLGASVAFRGIKNSVPFIHGGQGCATYIRRYLISHYKEPVDIASSAFSESTTIFGGGENLIAGLENVIKQYSPDFIGIATSCLAETIGEDVRSIINEFKKKHAGEKLPAIIAVQTPSYNGTHMDGFYRAVKKTVEALASDKDKTEAINVFPSFITPADIRYLKEIIYDFNINALFMPDYSETLDAPIWDEYKKIPEGGTGVDEIKRAGGARATITLGESASFEDSAGAYLEAAFGVKNYSMAIPIGIKQSDAFFETLSKLSGKILPEKYLKERGRLLDAYADGHKYVFGKRAVIYGEEDLVTALANFALEIGIVPVICASGGNSGAMEKNIITGEYKEEVRIIGGVDFAEIAEMAKSLSTEIFIGSSKGYRVARELGVPHLRVGFPVHDRFGGQRILSVGYRGTQELFDRIVNAFIEEKQSKSSLGYSYI